MTTHNQAGRAGREGWRSAAFGDVLFGQWLPRTFYAETANEFRRVTLGARARDKCFYTADKAGGVVFQFLFLPDGGAYPWACVGGGPLYHDVEENQAHPSNDNTVKDLATAGPKLAIPFPGVWDVTFGVEMYNEVVGHYTVAHLGYGPVAGAPAGWTSLTSADTLSSAAVEPVPAARAIATTQAATGREFRVRYLATGGVGRFRKRWLRAQPSWVAG